MNEYAGLLTTKIWSKKYSMGVQSLPYRLRHLIFSYVYKIIYNLNLSGFQGSKINYQSISAEQKYIYLA